MTERTPEGAFADFAVAIADTLEVICRQLIERGYLSKELLISDLVEMSADLERRDVFEPASALPTALASLLAETSPGQHP